MSAGPRQFATEDYAQLLSHPVDATEAWLPVEGVTQVWYITKGGNKNVTLQERERGHFYSADCYLALHVFSDQVRSRRDPCMHTQYTTPTPTPLHALQTQTAHRIH